MSRKISNSGREKKPPILVAINGTACDISEICYTGYAPRSSCLFSSHRKVPRTRSLVIVEIASSGLCETALREATIDRSRFPAFLSSLDCASSNSFVVEYIVFDKSVIE